MRRLLLLLLLVSGCTEPVPALADSFNLQDERLANIIWQVEGGAKTRYPYGIRSIPTYGNVLYARKLCITSIQRSRVRWIKAGRPGDWLLFFSRRWSPVGATNDPTGLNRNFLRNVRSLLSSQ